jgi:hypothetical protein
VKSAGIRNRHLSRVTGDSRKGDGRPSRRPPGLCLRRTGVVVHPLHDTPETAFEEVASALWPYALYSEKARLWCSFKAMLGRLLPIKRRSLKPASRPPESVTDPIVASAERPPPTHGTLVRPRP